MISAPSSTDHVVVQVGGQPYGVDDPAGGVAHEDDGLNALGPQDGVKRAAGERTGAVLGDDGLPSLGATEGGSAGRGPPAFSPVARMGAPQVVLGGNLGITGPEMRNAVGDEIPACLAAQALPSPLEGLPLVHDGVLRHVPGGEIRHEQLPVVLLSSVISAIHHLPLALTPLGYVPEYLRMP